MSTNSEAVTLGDICISNDMPFTLISGVNVLEDDLIHKEVIEELLAICKHLHIKFIFKASYEKANRSSIDSYIGPGIEKGIKTLEAIKNKYDIPIITDVHTPEEAFMASKVCDALQLPAFLARQTKLIKAIAETGKVINIKKPQFISPSQTINIIEKFKYYGNDNILLCERGTNFGYDNLVVDMLGFGVMKSVCRDIPLIFDVTHSLQCRVSNSLQSGGRRSQILDLAKSGISQRIAGLFLEIHPNPSKALCDGPSALPLKLIKPFLSQLKELDDLIKNQNIIKIK